MKKLFNNLNNNFFIDLFIVFFLSHIFYKITFIESIQGEYSLISQIKNGDVTSKSFFVESPTFTVLSLALGIEDFDMYRILIYAITILCFILISYNLQFLKKYSSLFLFGGWLITSSWFLGYVDIISVFLIILIGKHLFQNKLPLLKISLYLIILSINHNAISFVICIIFFVLISGELKKKIVPVIVSSQILGNTLIKYYLTYIGFEGRGRLRFVFNDNVIQNSVNFVGNNFITVFWSGFLGTSFLILLIGNTLSWNKTRNIFISILIALFFTSIALDTSRIFSLLVTPVILYTLNEFKNSVIFQKKLSVLYSISIFTHFIVGVYYFYGSTLTESPMTNLENFYDFITRIVNSLMSNIWS